MQEFSSILNHFTPLMTLSEEEQQLLVSVMRVKKVKRKQFVEQPGYVSKYRSFVAVGALRAFFLDKNEQEHTISLAIENGWIGDPGSFLLQEPATLFVEAIEDSTLIQWSYENEQLLVEKIPAFSKVIIQQSQKIAVMLQRRLIAQISLTAEQCYTAFAEQYPAFIQRIPLYLIASYLGMTREFLSKIRNQKIVHKG